MERLLRRREVEAATGLSRSSIYLKMRQGAFPEPLKVGPNAVRWREDEIRAWLDAKPRATGQG